MFRPQGNCPNLDNFRRGEAGPDGGPSGNSYKAYPSRFRPCLSGCVPYAGWPGFHKGEPAPGRDGGDSPRFGKNLTVPTAHVHTGTSRVHRVGGDHVRSIQANTVPWTARIAPGANVLLRAPYGSAAGNPAAMGRRVRPHRPRGNPPFQVAGYVRRRRCNGRQVEDRPTLGTKPPEQQRCRSGGAHRVTQPY